MVDRRVSAVPPGLDLYVVDPDEPVAQFGASVNNASISPGGDARLTLIVPFDQIPRMMPVMQHVGGATFQVTIARVPADDMPGSGW